MSWKDKLQERHRQLIAMVIAVPITVGIGHVENYFTQNGNSEQTLKQRSAVETSDIDPNVDYILRNVRDPLVYRED